MVSGNQEGRVQQLRRWQAAIADSRFGNCLLDVCVLIAVPGDPDDGER